MGATERITGVEWRVLSNGGPDTANFQSLEDGDPRIVGGYRLMARLGSGGMGRVYLSHTPGGRAVAVKVIRPELAESAEFRKRFRAEVAAASRVHGLYTAPVVDSDTEGSMPWCATAYVPGPSLADAVRDHGPLPVDTVLRLIAGVAEALQAVHREGIVHRDLKPSNVLLASDGPRVIDFGVARAADTTSMTQSGTALGTVAYMAPERVLGGEAAASADVFALGQTAVFAATGGAAFGDGEPHAVLYRVVHEEPDLSHVPGEIRELLARCLRKPAAERPSVEAVIRSVQTIRATRGDDVRFTSGAWLPGELAAGIAARTEGADQARAGADPRTHSPGGFGPARSYTPTEPSHAVLPGPFVMGSQAVPGAYAPPPGPQPQDPAGAATASVAANRTGRRARVWMLSAAAVVLVACGATAALLLVPADGDKSDHRAQDAAVSQSAPVAEAPPSTSGSPSAKASKTPKPTKPALQPSLRGPQPPRGPLARLPRPPRPASPRPRKPLPR